MIQVLLGEFREKLTLLKDLVPRDAKFPDAPNKIKVAIGMRRAGKTYFVYQHILQLIREGTHLDTILYLNFEDDRLLPLNEQKLAQFVDAFYTLYPQNHDRKCFLFFDEIQNVTGWPTVIRRLHDTKNVEIFLTGSSAKLLSKEISTSLRGRSLATEIWPYSFSEFLRAKKTSLDTSLFNQKIKDILFNLFHDYLSTGGFPEVVSFTPDIQQQTLQEYLDITIYRDIVERHEIKHPTLIKYMILSMIYNVAKPFSINKFYNDLQSQGYSIGKDLLYEYANYIEDAYLAFSIPIYDRSIRKIYTNPKKLYAIDPGMVRAVTLDYEKDLGRLFENIVFLDLRRLGCTVHYYLTKERHEVDFLAQTGRGHKKLFQVAWNIDDTNTMQREERALEEAKEELRTEGDIITLDSYLRNGITVRPLHNPQTSWPEG